MLLNGLNNSGVHNFIDDILIGSDHWEDHVKAIEEVLARIDEAGLKVKPTKCYLGYQDVEFLGHHIGDGKMSPGENNLEKIKGALPPTTKKQVRSFLGLLNFYRRYIKGFAAKAKPLTDLTKKEEPDKVRWNEQCDKAFKELKEDLVSKPITKLPNLNEPFVLRTDASEYGIGAVLLQAEDDILKPVSFASRKLNAAESNYSVMEKECLAIVWGVKYFEQYLYGINFVIQTDHSPLTVLKKNKCKTGRIARWALQLQRFSFQIEVIPGKENIGADYLSRIG